MNDALEQMMLESMGLTLNKEFTIESLVEQTKDGGAQIIFHPAGLEVYAINGGIYLFKGEPMSFSKGKASAVLALMSIDEENYPEVQTERIIKERSGMINLIVAEDHPRYEKIQGEIVKLNKLFAEKGMVDVLTMTAEELKEVNDQSVAAMVADGENLETELLTDESEDNSEEQPTLH